MGGRHADDNHGLRGLRMPRVSDLAALHRSVGSLFEAPRYDPARGLVFSDARLGGVLALSPVSGLQTLIAHRRGIGGLARHQGGGFVVTGRNVAVKEPDFGGEAPPTAVVLDGRDCPGAEGFNDLTVDASGRVYVGTLVPGAIDAPPDHPDPPSGSLVLVAAPGAGRVVAEDIRVPNGVALSGDGSELYLCDSGRRVVFGFPVDADSGELGPRSVLIEVDPGVPDGIAVAQDGSVWLAHAYAGFVARYTPEGRLMETWPVPDPLVTSLCFGGDDGRLLYVTTGTHDDGGEAGVYVGEADVAGVPVPLARVTPAA